MAAQTFNKFRAAIEVLQRGRDSLVESLADEVLTQEDDLLDSGFLFNEFLEAQGTRLHFLSLLVSQLEQSADALGRIEFEPRSASRTTAETVSDAEAEDEETLEASIDRGQA